MRDILESKLMVSFIVVVLGFIYINASITSRLETTNSSKTEDLITMNVK